MALQEVRLARMEAKMAQREAEVEEALAQRIETLKARAISAKAVKFATVQSSRTKVGGAYCLALPSWIFFVYRV